VTVVPDDIVFDGGSEDDRREIVGALEAYLAANAAYDWRKLAEIWSDDPTNVFFNMNGHTYVGLAHWTRLWQYYRERVDTGWWEPYDVKVLVRTDMALITCHRRTARRWKGPEAERLSYDADRPSFVSRSTMVMVKDAGGWKTIHVHFSPGDPGPRPGDV
jgi:ketosteroid isomerase-like protein